MWAGESISRIRPSTSPFRFCSRASLGARERFLDSLCSLGMTEECMKFILGKKIEMSQLFNEAGDVEPVTLVEVGPCLVTYVKTREKDGYEAVQLGFGKKKNLTKPLRGHLKGLGDFRWVREYRISNQQSVISDQENISPKRGDKITVEIFKIGDKVKVTGTSKGRGFQGVVKRHGFHGAPASHGHKDQERMPGSIGSKRIGSVAKGKRMAGHMGAEQVTVKNLEIVKIEPEKNLLYLKGAVPGARGSLVEIRG